MIVRKHETPKEIKREILGYKEERQTEFIFSSLSPLKDAYVYSV